jgi:RNA polymerase-binding protein DksA
MAVAKKSETKILPSVDEILNQERRQLRARLAGLDEETQIDIVPDDEGAAATRSLIEDLALDSRERRTQMLNDVEDALRRLHEGSYGVCGNCENEIGERRLQALPWARLCLACAEEQQRHSSN